MPQASGVAPAPSLADGTRHRSVYRLCSVEPKVIGFVISLALRAAQGSATVAIVTTPGLLTSAVMEGGYSPAQTAVIVIAIGFGALGLSHVTDAGFCEIDVAFGPNVSSK